MKTTYTILLLIVATTLIHAQEPAKWNPERTPFATGIRRDAAHPCFTSEITTATTINYPLPLQTEMFPEFTLSSGDFLTLKDFGFSKDSGTGSESGYKGTQYDSVENALKIPVGNGWCILLWLLVCYVVLRNFPKSPPYPVYNEYFGKLFRLF